ncbi:LuxR C-terminal-related transcriptional regulator [Streptomyces sp. NPDC050560]|uniref:helix-turn-helix transcriptional regulator n=1 Tax=Streptomyces sp. NPDC050560 TaxID=3365630 RepID=UPI0037BC3B74
MTTDPAAPPRDLLTPPADPGHEPAHQHGDGAGDTAICAACLALYARALQDGRLSRSAAGEASCLGRVGAWRTDPDDAAWLRPVSPAVLLPEVLRFIEDGIARERRREVEVAALFEPLMALEAQSASSAAQSAITVLRDHDRINAALWRAAAHASREILTVQPGGRRDPAGLSEALPHEQEVLDRGASMRTLYQHTSRYSSAVLAHYEQLRGDVQVRTLHEVTDRLIVFDRSVAFIPANSDRTAALELRHPGLVQFLVTTFDRLWHMATPMWPRPVEQPSVNGVTTRQRAIARLLIDGLTDEKIAARLGMNVRTVRVHIAKLATTLGSENRAQLGYLIGESGILQQP